MKKKHDILSGVGSCARFGFIDKNTYYCGTGAQCNNFIGKTCWNPAGNAQATAPCSSSDWQCKVWTIEISQIIFIMFIYVLFFLIMKTDLKTGLGSCTGYGFIDADAFYCGTGNNCNNWSNFKCSNPLNQTEIQCTSSDWQCKVRFLFCFT